MLAACLIRRGCGVWVFRPALMRRPLRRSVTTVLWALSAIGWHSGAFAYRPFDGTDAACRRFGRGEIELGPVDT